MSVALRLLDGMAWDNLENMALLLSKSIEENSAFCYQPAEIHPPISVVCSNICV